jgi:glycosyltransferase involved in cell wall biosynthesis
MIEVTAVILTKNEAANIGECLRDLRWCRERIVVDSGSTDDTVRIAQEEGAVVLVNKPEGHFRFSEQRNWTMANARLSTRWVLFIDADERVPEPLREAIAATIEKDGGGFDSYELPAQFMFWGRWLKRTQGYPNWHARLLRVGAPGFAGGVWEHFAEGSRIGRLHQPYLHFANSKGFGEWLERHARYADWDARTIHGYLVTGRSEELRTARKLRLRRLFARLWPLRPLFRFVHMYFLRLGFIEGVPALAFCLMYFFYEFMIVVRIVELRRKAAGLPL